MSENKVKSECKVKNECDESSVSCDVFLQQQRYIFLYLSHFISCQMQDFLIGGIPLHFVPVPTIRLGFYAIAHCRVLAYSYHAPTHLYALKFVCLGFSLTIWQGSGGSC